MALRDEVLQTLSVHGPLDDDQLGNLLERNRHYVNQVCRRLVADGLARRVDGPDGKLVTELVNGKQQAAATPTPSDRLTAPHSRRLSRDRRARQNVEQLVEEFGESVRRFETSSAFPGPSLYFHERALERRRAASRFDELQEDRQFWEYVYAVLPAWGMHRMGSQAAKVGNFADMVSSFLGQSEAIGECFDLRITQVSESDRDELAGLLWAVIGNLEVSTSRTRIVAGSKALHHVLPDLVPPIDRQYTFRFFTGHKNIAHIGGAKAFREWFPLLCEVAQRNRNQIREALERGGFMATGEAKVVDNAIIGFMQDQDAS